MGLLAAGGLTNSRWSRLAWLLLASAGVLLCAKSQVVRAADAARARLGSAHSARVGTSPGLPAAKGVFKLLTYNIAGLPGVLSGSDPANNTGQVSPLLNYYDVVLAQEDFAYHAELVQSAVHRYQSPPSAPGSNFFGDGLATLSKLPVRFDARIRWESCNGYLFALSDCFADKGFSSAQLQVTANADLALINLHADAGHSDGDVAARRAGFSQLAAYISRRFAGHAVIVAGDTNLDQRDPRDQAILDDFLLQTGLRELCRSFLCEGQNLDRVLYRSSNALELTPLAWHADGRFVGEGGMHLSDHPAMAATFAWEAPHNGRIESPALVLAAATDASAP